MCENKRALAATSWGWHITQRVPHPQEHRTAWEQPQVNSLLFFRISPGWDLGAVPPGAGEAALCLQRSTLPKENKPPTAGFSGRHTCTTPKKQELTGFCSVALLECCKYSKFLAFPATVLSPHTTHTHTHTIWYDTRIFLECRKSWTRNSNSWFLFDQSPELGQLNPNKVRAVKSGFQTCTYRHVGACANKGVCHGIYQLPTDTKVTKLDFTSRVYQNVGWFHIWEKKPKMNGLFRR